MLHCISAAGKILESQLIWEGATKQMYSSSSPEREVDGEATRMMHQTFSESHWTTNKTLLEYFDYLEVFRRAQSAISGRDEKMLVLLDCAPVHLSRKFREDFYAVHPNIFLIYVPPGCTSRYQPLDVVFMGIFKPYMRTLQKEVVATGQYSLSKGQQLLVNQQLVRDLCFTAACDTLAHMKNGASLGAEVVRRCWVEAGLAFCTQPYNKDKKMTAAWEQAWEKRMQRINNPASAASLFTIPIPTASQQIMSALNRNALDHAMKVCDFPVDYSAIGSTRDDLVIPEVDSDDDDGQHVPQAEWEANGKNLRKMAGQKGGRGKKRAAATVDLPTGTESEKTPVNATVVEVCGEFTDSEAEKTPSRGRRLEYSNESDDEWMFEGHYDE